MLWEDINEYSLTYSILHIPFLVAAVSECSLPSSTYLNLIGYLNLATAAA